MKLSQILQLILKRAGDCRLFLWCDSAGIRTPDPQLNPHLLANPVKLLIELFQKVIDVCLFHLVILVVAELFISFNNHIQNLTNREPKFF